MTLKIIDNLTFDIYVKKNQINIDLNNKEVLEEYLKKIFKRLKRIYNIDIVGFYNIGVYVDKYYGVIFHLEKEELEYYNYFKNQVDMRIVISDREFLYKVDNLLFIDKTEVIISDNELFLKINEELTNREMMILLEHSKIVYDK